jgi:hypothetical protein
VASAYWLFAADIVDKLARNRHLDRQRTTPSSSGMFVVARPASERRFSEFLYNLSVQLLQR